MKSAATAAIVAIFGGSMALNIAGMVADPHWLALPALLVGWYVADLLSGAIHMYMDYRPCPPGRGLDRLYFYEGSRASDAYVRLFRATMTPLNPFERLVYDFKNHHPRPDALGRRAMWRQIGSTVIAGTLPVSLLLNLAWLTVGLPGWVMAGFVALLIGGSFAQYFHGTLHRTDNPWIVRAMRKAGLLMTPEAHQLHHDTLKRDFSTNCGWSNPLLNRVFNAARARGHFDEAGLEPAG
ncbi:fatty acid desaturase CarF family protein [Sphingomonas sanxanigenens]|uniref:Lipid desaturase domain-containing protein n=1 Tax=Sphingomonas sanxanigenens DSM 19645 = NX02 TaxID=1123269 RepID=W0A8W7_9SPHN|nr:fatty acid desaturase CarF family protein [Sphingomonas sanxanigenens]AHE52110.1 hypothetical protein NX02_01740 [Sphingomonas sanxanigenens DSM 19645 = NX02]